MAKYSKKTLSNAIIILILFVASYFMLQSKPDETLYLILGVVCLIIGVYGIIKIYKKERFIF